MRRRYDAVEQFEKFPKTLNLKKPRKSQVNGYGAILEIQQFQGQKRQ